MAQQGSGWDEDVFGDDAARALGGASRIAHLLLAVIALFVVLFLAWAYNATLDEVTRGEGKVIPSSQIQVVQHLEGGILSALLVREGEVVDAGQPLLRIENKLAEADLAEKRKQYVSLLATASRLQAEARGEEAVTFPPEVLDGAPDIAEAERRLFERRRDQLDQQISILNDQYTQKRQELQEVIGKRGQIERQQQLAQQEYDLLRPLVQQGISPRIELIRVQQKLEELSAQLQNTNLAVPRTQAAMSEAERRIAEKRTSFQTDAQQELNVARVEAARLREDISAGIDRATRTEIRSPVRGTVNKVLINTLGGVVQPGADLIEIVPLEDALLVEARIKPADRAQLYPGQKAVVKLTAYDFAIYGGADAQLVDISADTITDDQGETFYRIRLRTDQTDLGADRPIIPGMTATVDILTGEKTVLQYLLKPILRAQENALRER